MGLLLMTMFLLALAALPLTLGAVAVRPCRGTVRAATVALLTFIGVVILLVLISASA